MISVAIIAGGPSAERGISLKSATTIASHLPADKYAVTKIDITPEGWREMDTDKTIDLNEFCLLNENGGIERKFDFAFII
ncbi:MAG TPA: D-alanine--D-alanine ligase, partial [Chitinophagaceae bacterium]|nr:D-alanine--D-alanine ligase [Chitinophagaceae bacterium]